MSRDMGYMRHYEIFHDFVMRPPATGSPGNLGLQHSILCSCVVAPPSGVSGEHKTLPRFPFLLGSLPRPNSFYSKMSDTQAQLPP
jgi:hypothetical protein